MLRPLLASIAIGFIATIAITGIYSVSESHSYLDYAYIFVRTTKFGLPLNWVLTTYPVVACGQRGCFIPGYPQTTLQIDWMAFAVDLLLLSTIAYPVTLLLPRIGRRIKTTNWGRFTGSPDQIVTGASVLSLVLVLYAIMPIGSSYLPMSHWATPQPSEIGVNSSSNLIIGPIFSYWQLPSYLPFLLLSASLFGISAALLSTWRFVMGGVSLVSCSIILIFAPGFFFTIFVLNPALAMLYIFSTSTMLVGGILALRKRILHLGSAAEREQAMLGGNPLRCASEIRGLGK